MKHPDWFSLIDQWRKKNMGVTGITLPFLVGALSLKEKTIQPSESTTRALLQEIINQPVAGYIIQVQWCPNIDAPVLSTIGTIAVAQEKMKCSFRSKESGNISLIFSTNYQSDIVGMGCSNENDCLEKLIEYAAEPISNGSFSRNKTISGEYEYGKFVKRDLSYIDETIM
ncbi:MAG: hypothetical protein AB2777_17795 [Candidatus Thiodiazotropha endolucinida]